METHPQKNAHHDSQKTHMCPNHKDTTLFYQKDTQQKCNDENENQTYP